MRYAYSSCYSRSLPGLTLGHAGMCRVKPNGADAGQSTNPASRDCHLVFVRKLFYCTEMFSEIFGFVRGVLLETQGSINWWERLMLVIPVFSLHKCIWNWEECCLIASWRRNAFLLLEVTNNNQIFRGPHPWDFGLLKDIFKSLPAKSLLKCLPDSDWQADSDCAYIRNKPGVSWMNYITWYLKCMKSDCGPKVEVAI